MLWQAQETVVLCSKHSFKNRNWTRNRSRVNSESESESVMNRFAKKYIKYLNFKEKQHFQDYNP